MLLLLAVAAVAVGDNGDSGGGGFRWVLLFMLLPRGLRFLLF